MLLVSILIMTLATIRKWATEDRKLKMITAFRQNASENKYAKLLLKVGPISGLYAILQTTNTSLRSLYDACARAERQPSQGHER